MTLTTKANLKNSKALEDKIEELYNSADDETKPKFLNEVITLYCGFPNFPIEAKRKIGILAGFFTEADLNALSPKKQALLLSQLALLGFSDKSFAFSDLKDLPEEKIELLVRLRRGWHDIKFSDLKDLPEEQIKLVLSGWADLIYNRQKNSYKWHQLKNLTEKQVRFLSMYEDATLEDLKNLDAKKIEALDNINLCFFITGCETTLDELKKLDNNILQLLGSKEVAELKDK